MGSVGGAPTAKKQSAVGKPKKLFYTVVATSAGKTGGKYSSRSGPAAAAKKAASRRFAAAPGGVVRLTMSLVGKEGKKGAQFKYEATRITLAKPVVRRVRSFKTIVSKYRVSIKSAD